MKIGNEGKDGRKMKEEGKIKERYTDEEVEG